GRTQSLVAEKTDISENRASRNFDMMIDKWCLLKITLQAPFLNVQKTFDRNRSSLSLHGNDAPFLNVQKTFDRNRSSLDLHGLVPQGQKASDYDNSDPVPPRHYSVKAIS
ncbi:hypothetical protein Tco_0107715, partial [Tanacetum coccineum]